MIDLIGIISFDWDTGNERKSADKHDVSPAQAEQVFFNHPLLLLEDAKHSGAELRFHALGKADDGRRLHIAFTLRRAGSLIRVISVRDMSAKERIIYEKSP